MYKYSLATGVYVSRVAESFPILVPYVMTVNERLEDVANTTLAVIERSIPSNAGDRLKQSEDELRRAVEWLLKQVASASYGSPD